MAEAAPEAELLRTSYHQWKFCQKLLKILKTQVWALKPERKIKYGKINGTFGRWLQSIQLFDRDQLDERYPLFPRAGEPLRDRDSTRELTLHLRNDLSIPDNKAQEITNKILTMVEEFLATDAEDNQEIVVSYVDHPDGNAATGGQIVVKDFSTPYSPRVSCFVSYFGELNTALVCLRYAPLAELGGAEDALSVTAINAMHDIGQVRHVGFSSPLNCRLLGRPGVEFCSLFPDTDAAFGSLGNFFNINLADHPGGWILNPPFVEPVMEAMARRVVQLLDETEPGAFWFFIVFPNWEDNEGWQIVNESAWKVCRIDVKKKNFFQQDPYGGHIYRPDIPLQIFILGTLPDSVDLISLRRYIDINDGNDLKRVTRDWLIACDIEV